jgi:tetratricopeptide (TPR) repeat protein
VSPICLVFLVFAQFYLLVGPILPGHAANERLLEQLSGEIASKRATDKTYIELGKLIESEPGNVRARLLLAESYEQLGLPELALEQYERAYKAAPNNAEALAALFIARLKAFQTNDAVQLLKAASERSANRQQLMLNVCNFLLTRSDSGSARMLYQRALRNKDIPADFASTLASIENKNKNYPVALHLANQALERDKDLTSAIEIKALALAHMNRYTEALPSLAIAFAHNRFDKEVATAYALSLLWAGHSSQALEPALVSLATAESQPDKEGAQVLLAHVLKKSTNSDYQKQCRAVMLELTSKQRAAFCFALAQVFDGCNMTDEAIQQYKIGLEIAPHTPQAWFHLANDLETHSQDYQDALKCYRQAQALMPYNQSVRDRCWRLEDRLVTQPTDLSWQLKDWLASLSVRKPEL